jgi:large subunit ribosomal protein L24
MKNMSIRKDDIVIVLSGKDKGQEGKVLTSMPKDGKVSWRRSTSSPATKPASRAKRRHHKREAPIYACKVMRVCPKCDKPTGPATKRWPTARRSASARSAALKSERGGEI